MISRLSPVFGQRDPDARGYYGPYGGRFVPETLVAPVEELEAAYLEARRRPGIPRRARRLCCGTTSAARRRSTRRGGLPAALGGARIFLKREDLAHTGAHKINNALGQALLAKRMGKRRVDRGDRRRAARRRDGDGLRAARPRMRRLHGRGGHGAAGAQRLPHASCSAPTVRRGRRRQPHAQGRDQRSDARLGHERRRQLLPARLGARPASVPADGARVPVRHRPGSAAPVSGAHRPAA